MAISRREIRIQQRHDRLMLSVEIPYIKAIIREKNRFIEAIARHYETEPSVPESMADVHRVNMFELGVTYNSKVIALFARDNLKNLQKSRDRKDDNFTKWLDTLIADWIFTETGTAARQTSNTTVKDIKDAINKSTEEGEFTNRAVADKILKVKGFSPFRADAIARTETHSAAMYANKESAKRISRTSGVDLLKKWIPVQDSRTRDAHAAMASHPAIPMDGLFTVGGARMDRPGDPRGGAANVINCRCTIAYETVD
jgi:hypothetical protein